MANGESQTNGGKLWGVSIDKWVQITQSFGVPTLIVAFFMYLAYCYVPPIVDGHLKLLERTSETLAAMERTLAQSNAILDEVNQVEQETKAFMARVCDDHNKADGKLDTIIEQTKN